VLAFGAEIEKTVGHAWEQAIHSWHVDVGEHRGSDPADHPIRKIRVVIDTVLAELDPVFDETYATSGRRSVRRR